eukprot:TRINITY_DN16216_c0_g1_i1.p1 TRINITY_DN16216_c0_g1~~TRINITY_DN16216_c0_g1_i1.p1  ORF type:complete len:285 (+),score=30.68 TRINITY_DN16216_c0_g1_i1:129-983(+)
MASTSVRSNVHATSRIFANTSSRQCHKAGPCSSNAAFGGAGLRRHSTSPLKKSLVKSGGAAYKNRAGFRVSASAERPVWLPGTAPAKHLDGTRPGDFGFDPLGLGTDPADLAWYVQAELVHARFAMLGAAGILGQEILRVTGRDIPIWYETGAATYFAPTGTLFLVQMLLFGFVEAKRYYDFVNPGSQKDAWFFGIEASLEGLEPGYPGGPFFNITGLGTGITAKDDVFQMRTKELKNGRLAMVAVLGFIVQALVTKTGPIENLLDHLADPFHVTVANTLGGGL